MNHQHSCGQPVTKKSQAILRKAILREEWELSNDEVTLGAKLGNVRSICVIIVNPEFHGLFVATNMEHRFFKIYIERVK